ncbi:uncharacterized protein LOC126990168 [Eriocheir sinensis]|uniref:uncharacterized protein LOC126990168 n=1 Tax=Eriocheir sinensis TaxID=95602 RepID=UPI0021C8A171|nr:uncharacterized protein LOC126990168 [Eriocheir sinensis]
MTTVWNEQRPLKVVVVGDSTVGKTSLLNSYNTGKFHEAYVPIVYENFTGTHTVDGVSYTLVMWDTGGQEEYERLRPLSYHGTHVFILCFALDNRASFENVSSKWLPELHKHCPKTPIVLVGTKMDVRNLDVLMPHDGKELVERHQVSKYVECSAKTQEGLQEVFDAVVRTPIAAVDQRSRRCVII